jgi:type I restriction enzyme S subunit
MIWPSATLGSIATIDRLSVQPNGTSGRYVGLEHITSDGVINIDHGINTEDLASSKFAFTPAHILFGKLRPYLRKVARPSFSGICSTDILPIHPHKGIDKDYLFHYLRTAAVIDLATARSSGANLPRISPSVLSEFPVPVPPLAEQKRIAAILDKADAIGRKREQAIKLADEFLRSLFLDMFGDPVRNPKGWPVEPLAKLIASGPQNGLYRPSSDYGSGTPIVRIDSFDRETSFDVSSLKRLRISEELQATYGLHQNDLLINRVNSRSHLGKSVLVPALSEPVVFESNMMRLRLKGDLVDSVYAIYFLRTSRIKRQIQTLAKDAVNQASINQSDVLSLEFLLPPLADQIRFAEISAHQNGLRSRCDRLEGLQRQLNLGLSQVAFRGTL